MTNTCYREASNLIPKRKFKCQKCGWVGSNTISHGDKHLKEGDREVLFDEVKQN